MSAESPCLWVHDRSRCTHVAWPQGANLAEQDPRNPCSENRAHLPLFDKPPDDGAVPLLQRHERNIRFQLAAVDEHKALIVEHGIKLGSGNEAMAVPNTLADICCREVTVFHFVGGATRSRPSTPPSQTSKKT